MKLIDKKIYLDFDEVVGCGITTYNYLKVASSTGKGSWDFLKDPDDKRKTLVGYDALSVPHKKLICERYGDPYILMAQKPILDMVTPDLYAGEFYRKHSYEAIEHGIPVTKYLPEMVQRKYCRAASWLALINRLQKDNAPVRLGLKMKMTDFYTQVANLIRAEIEYGKDKDHKGDNVMPGDFPTSYVRLLAKAATFKAEGYGCLIDHLFGNRHKAKLGKVTLRELVSNQAEASTALIGEGECAGNEVVKFDNSDILPTDKRGGFDTERYSKQMAVIRSIAAKHNNLDAEQIATFANILFEANGWETIGGRQVRNILKRIKPLLTPARRGKRASENEHDMQIKRVPPKLPMTYWTLDGWTIELGYRDGNSYGRLVAVVVLDAFNKYPIGFAIGERETPELIREANRNALFHVGELLGSVYRPWQLQSDRYSIKNLTDFYQAVGKLYIPARAGNAKGKIIEPYFRMLNDKYCRPFANWTGHNVDAAKENQVNREFANQVKKVYPTKEGVMAQFTAIMSFERKKKLDAYMTAWNNAPDQHKVRMETLDWMEVFGQPVGKPVTMRGEGLKKQIGNNIYVYDCFEPEFRNCRDIKWTIVMDFDNPGMVMAKSPDGQKKFLLNKVQEVPMAAIDHTPEDWEHVQRVRDYNKEQRDDIIDMYAQDNQVIAEVINNTPLQLNDHQEFALKMMFTDNRGQQKEGLQDAKQLGKKNGTRAQLPAGSPEEVPEVTADWAKEQEEFMRSSIDISAYM